MDIKKIFGADVYYQSSPAGIDIQVVYPGFNIVCPDSLFRKGEFGIKLDSAFYLSNAKGTVSFVSYAVEDILVSGVLGFENLGQGGDQGATFNFETTALNLSLPDSVHSISWRVNKTIAWVAGWEKLQDFGDDVFEISGTSGGRSSRGGHSFSTQTSSALIANHYCRWIPEVLMKF